MIEIRTIYKYFGNTPAVNGIEFTVQNGEIYGLLGPNGSGKTTMMKMLVGLLPPTKGEIRIDGKVHDPVTVKEMVGYVPESPVLYESLTPYDLFNLVGKIRNIPQHQVEPTVDYFVHAFEIEKYCNQLVGTLSFGTKQKVSLITALMHNPSILVLDEAMNGLDPKSARILREILLEYKKEGKSIVFSTHILPLAEMMCDRMGVIDNGDLIAEGTVDELKSIAHEKNLEDVFLTLTESKEDIKEILNAMKGV
jgi:ABC-2 type transport system ATP-binding protein